MDNQNNSFDEVLQTRCWSCKAAIDAEDNFCRVCGKGRGKRISWYYSHWGAIALTLLLGPFSLYFIWKSPIISHTAKWVYTAIISIITWYVAFAIYHMWVFIQQLMGQTLIY